MRGSRASTAAAEIAPALVRRLYDRAGAARWGLAEADFEASLRRSLAHRFREAPPSEREAEEYLGGLHLADLALAGACARGSEPAWEHFVHDFRPALLAAASAAGPGAGRELADSLYADLFGTEERDGVRRSLFDYFHGRCSLNGWLRAVLAQRAVDRARASRRLEPLPEPGTPGEPSVPAQPPEVDRSRRLVAVRAALAAALQQLPARDRLRLSLYYARELKLAAVGRVLGESEATVSRKLARCRTGLRQEVERRLRERHGMNDTQVADAFELARTDPAFDLARALPPE
ncbi:MAG TPA: sigma-70 family RNA polymerase sigma factor [Vicinamibacterales bacterium]|nr:sigma-70 family RNA polymerase sigma factor [Acidobacteriota bacterium]HOC16840.1 sigma-70 family RNA polymerase sigma factor [Vicinamibacterales bacterium]